MRHPFQAFITLSFCVSALLVSGCTWEPVARPVQPQQVFEGPARTDRMLDGESRFALVQVGADESLRWRIVDGESLDHCELRAGLRPIQSALSAPNLPGAKLPKLLLPLRRLDDQDNGIYFSDERCVVQGPIGSIVEPRRAVVSLLGLRSDQRQVLLVLDQGRLSVVDPWTSSARMVAERVSDFRVVEPPASANQREPEALWLIENKQLVQRALDGSVLLTPIGTEVSQLVQRRFEDGLRVAFRDGGDVFEAKGPDFVPKLIAANACAPSYRLTALDMWLPCAERQLVRMDLTTGTVRRFAPGVYESTTIGAVEIEKVRTAAMEEQLWVASGTNQRTQILPLPVSGFSMLGTSAIVARTSDNRFGVWNMRGEFTQIFEGVRELVSYRSLRTSEFEWLMLHDMKSDLGRISTFEQRDIERMMLQGQAGFQPRTLAEGVPAGGFRLHGGVGPEPIILTLEQASPMQTIEGFSGTLHARLLSGALEARIDVGVSSTLLVVTPQAGILYAIGEGPKSGLWFAAL